MSVCHISERIDDSGTAQSAMYNVEATSWIPLFSLSATEAQYTVDYVEASSGTTKRAWYGILREFTTPFSTPGNKIKEEARLSKNLTENMNETNTGKQGSGLRSNDIGMIGAATAIAICVVICYVSYKCYLKKLSLRKVKRMTPRSDMDS
ncbi:hypothetical protein SNE40_020631 [Patella caerulea]|uniref:Uncharacterized protein n=1 Tax=Patella caerulea TaxID=87958 RepID=A0AAN8J5A7_PATCE